MLSAYQNYLSIVRVFKELSINILNRSFCRVQNNLQFGGYREITKKKNNDKKEIIFQKRSSKIN